LLLAVIPAVYLTSMILLEDNNTIPEIPTPSLNDLGGLKNPQRREEDSTAVSVIMTEFVTARPEAFPLTNLKLHSPSGILGTPLDPSSRFEYPFPSPQLEYEPRNSHFHPSQPSNLLPAGPTSARQRQSYVHPKHEVREVPVPPTLDKRMSIELRFPRPMEGVNVFGQAQTSIKRRTDVKDTNETS